MSKGRRYRSDDRDLDGHDLDLLILPPDGNGDWYVSVLPHGDKLGPAVRVTTSGSPGGQHGACVAVAHLYRALGGESFPDDCPLHGMWTAHGDAEDEPPPIKRSLVLRLAAEVRRLREQDALVNRDHQRLEDRVAQAEAERDRARAVAAQAEALMQDRERLTQQVRDFKDAVKALSESAKLAMGHASEHVREVDADALAALERIAAR